MAAPGAALSYTPAPHELAYYDGLFQVADQSRTGNIGGAQAVAFFQTSKLPVEVLKNIWTLADQNPTTNSLDRRKFHIAVRLIELSQNGQKAQGANLATPPGVTLRPVVFEGVSGVSVPMPGAAPPPQQQQQPPPPPQQQQQQQQPAYRQPSPIPQQTRPSPYRQPSPIPQQQPAAASQALTTQDPYTMYPGDLARYEQLFPQYEVKKDGYVYGKEAVELFSKSGILQNQLRNIWNMVDIPVDNRLDKLEFAMAMHLIVCVSKKHLPLPTALPISLKALKQQEAEAAAAAQQQMPPEPQQAYRPPLHPPQPGFGGPSSPGSSPMRGAAPAIQTVPSTDSGTGSLQGPPPIVPQGGASIHDAFAGLGPTPQSFDSAGPPKLPEPAAAPSIPEPAAMSIPEPAAMSIPEPTHAAMSIPEPTHAYSAPQEQAPAPTPVMAPAPAEEPKDTKALASSYNMGDDHAELEKLKVTLQKLQAEKIALQAQLGSMSEEEKEVQKEVAATIHEIGELSNELTGLRAKVIASKSALIEATAELKAATEKKGMTIDMLSEAKETKEALDAAHAAITAVESSSALQQNPASFQGDLFGFDAPAPAPAPEYSPLPAPAPAADVANPSPSPHVSPVSDDDDVAEEPDSRPLPLQPELSSKPEPPAPAPAAAWDPMAIQKNPSYEEYGVMGGESPPKHNEPVWGAAVAEATANSYGEIPAVTSAPSAEEVQEIKQKLSQAEETARDAEEQRRRLAEKADQLKREAAAAEQAAKNKEAHAQEKKRGFGRGKKKEKKEAEKMSQDALDKKRQFMEAQAEAQNAQTMASELKHEADKLRKQAEKVELDLAAAASVVEHQKETVQRQNNPLNAPSLNPAANGGMQTDPAPSKSEFGNGGAPMGGFGGGFGVMGGGGGGGLEIPTPSGEGYGDGFGFGVMGGGGGGGGGDGIPTPPQSAAGDNPYSNPF